MSVLLDTSGTVDAYRQDGQPRVEIGACDLLDDVADAIEPYVGQRCRVVVALVPLDQ